MNGPAPISNTQQEPQSVLSLSQRTHSLTMTKTTQPRTWRQRILIALGIYLVCTLVFAWAARDRFEGHTLNNHFAVQAEVWHQGRWFLTEADIVGRHNRHELDMHNDWAVVKTFDSATQQTQVRYYNSFPVFPALLMYPWVALAGRAIEFRDTLFIVSLAGIGPALLFLALEMVSHQRRSRRTLRENIALSLLYAFGTVYFFSAVQGSVWFAAHVVAAALTSGYLLAVFASQRWIYCALAGLIVGCGFHTRTPFLMCIPLFMYEAARHSLRNSISESLSLKEQVREFFNQLSWRDIAIRYSLFFVPIALALAVNLVINQVRFGNPFEFGHTLLNVGWMDRVKRWGLFSYHYLSRNLTCAFTLLPIVNPADAPTHVGRVQVSGNGLALWFTTPMFFWLLWPRVKGALHVALWVSVIAIALPDLLYQNSGWFQFGYRFSNDFSAYLFVLLALGSCSLGWLFRIASVWAVAINLWGAITFQRPQYQKYYFAQTYSVPVYNGSSALQTSTYPPD